MKKCLVCNSPVVWEAVMLRGLSEWRDKLKLQRPMFVSLLTCFEEYFLFLV
jgi:hypothetical protein